MKKYCFLVLFILSFVTITAQSGFKLGAHVGITTGDLDPAYGLNLGIDAGYVWEVADNVEVGVATGFSSFFVKSDYSDYFENINLIPVAATGQYTFDGGFNIGLDLGYGFFANDGADGGFLYQPKIGYNFNFGNVYAGYKGVSVNGGTVSAINIGLSHKF